MMTSFFNLLKYAATGIASPDMSYYDKLRASTLMGGVVQTLTGIPPLSFNSNGKPLTAWSMLGDGQQTGTPTPDNPITPDFVGTLNGADWTIPITCAEQTVPVYLGQVSTVRKIRKLVVTGSETWYYRSGEPQNVYFIELAGLVIVSNSGLCSHYINQNTGSFNELEDKHFMAKVSADGTKSYLAVRDSSISNVADFKSWLQQQYANGTPVTIWYVLAEPTTGIVNEPLCKIGDYADELHSSDAGVTIPTAKGANTLTVGGDLQPSEMTITFKG